MDDVLLLETKPKETRNCWTSLTKVAEKYHIKFGKEKSQSLTIGKTNEQPKFSLGQMQVEPTEKYKYLREMVIEKQIEGKLEAKNQAMLVIAGDWHFKTSTWKHSGN